MSVRDLKIRDISVSPGEKKFCWLKIGEMQDSRPAEIPLILINGLREGPTLYVQATQDAAELDPIAIIQRSIAKLDPRELSGRIICVVIANFFGFHAKVNWNPLDRSSFNRFWPGKPDGNNSERIISQLWNEAVLHSNYAIDLHATGTRPSIGSVYIRVESDEPHYDEVFELARAFGFGYILVEKDHTAGPLAERKFSYQATIKGIPTITPETSGGRGWNEECIQKGVRGVINVLKHLRMLDGKPEVPSVTYVVSRMQQITANRGGFIEYKAKLGDTLKKGDVLADIIDPFGRVLESVKAPEDGILCMKNEYPMVNTGESVASLGVNVRRIP